ncbi:MAG: CYTH domain-containing protein [Gammaproteobacteria bacterium]|nr:CYTH domain-containing protein [Gammaproteobacteria bacterium]
MAVEIERKFTLKNDHWRRHVRQSKSYRQGYLSGGQQSSVRVRIEDQLANINIKSATLGIHRQEYEYAIPLKDAHELLNTLCVKPLIEKTRHFVEHQGKTWEVDEFHGDNAGLIVAEIELSSENEQFPLPEWVDQEVSHDVRYYNVSLVKHPYKDWK